MMVKYVYGITVVCITALSILSITVNLCNLV